MLGGRGEVRRERRGGEGEGRLGGRGGEGGGEVRRERTICHWFRNNRVFTNRI